MGTQLFLALILAAPAALILSIFAGNRAARTFVYILTGILIGPVFGLVGADVVGIQQFAEFGIVILILVVSTRIDVRFALRNAYEYGTLALAQYGLTVLLLVGAAWAMGQPWTMALAVGLVLGFGSLIFLSGGALVGTNVSARGRQIAIYSAAFEGLLVIAVIALLPLLAVPGVTDAPIADGHGAGAGDHQSGSVGLLDGIVPWMRAVVTLATFPMIFLLHRFVLVPLIGRAIRRADRELFHLVLLAYVVGLALLATLVGLSPVLLMLPAGLLIGASAYRADVAATLAPVSHLLVGLFLITVGSSLNFGVVYESFLTVVLLAAAILAIRGAVLITLARLRGFDRRLTVDYMLSLLTPGEIGFVLLGLAASTMVLPSTLVDLLLSAIAINLLVVSALTLVLRSERKTVRPRAALKVFLSYSRADDTTARYIADRIEAAGIDILMDVRSLPFGRKWQVELLKMLKGSDVCVFLVSEASLGSEWCAWELRQLQLYGKRIIPVRVEDVPPETLPTTLAEVQVLPAEGLFDPRSRVHRDMVIGAIEADHDWVTEQNAYLNRALDWAEAGRPGELLLNADDLRAVRDWQARQPSTAPPPSLSLTEFVDASAEAAA